MIGLEDLGTRKEDIKLAFVVYFDVALRRSEWNETNRVGLSH
jgi:hypothetical protein